MPQQVVPAVIHQLPVWETPDGVHHVAGVREVHKCGCKIEGGGTCPHPLRVVFCPLHEAADDLLAACKLSLDVFDTMVGMFGSLGSEREGSLRASLVAAIAKAEGR